MFYGTLPGLYADTALFTIKTIFRDDYITMWNYVLKFYEII